MSRECRIERDRGERTRDKGTDRAVKSLAIDGESIHYYHQQWYFRV